MEKHLHMSYDAPTNVRLKVSNEYYTMMVDWFGNNFVKRREFDEKYDV